MENIKILKLKNVSLAALLIASATLAACSSSDDNIIEEQPVNPTAPKTYTMTIRASKGDDAGTRGLSLDGKTLNVTWNEGEEVEVMQRTQVTPEVWTSLGKLKAKASDNGTTMLTGELTGLTEALGSTHPLVFYLHSIDRDYTEQNGVLDRDDNATKSIEDNYDYAQSSTVSDFTVDGNTVTVSGSVTLTSLQAIVKFTLKDAITGNPLNATSLKIKGSQNMIESMSPTAGTKLTKELTITPPSATNVIYAAISSVGNSNFTLTATTGDNQTYTYEKSGVTFAEGKYYEITVKMHPEAVDLGLSVKWAPMNLGATTETDRGYYFAWAGTTGYAYGSGHDFSQDNAPYSSGGTYSKYKVSDYPALQAGDDAATVHWGGQWRMPTPNEWEELKNNCTAEWKENYKGSGINGILFTSNKEGFTDKSIFLPANGYYYRTDSYYPTIYVLYWSSDYDLEKNAVTQAYTNYGYAYVFDVAYGNNQLYWTNNSTMERYRGLGIRAVCP